MLGPVLEPYRKDVFLVLMEGFAFDTILFPFNFAAWYNGNFGPQVMEEAQKRGMGKKEIAAIKEKAMKTDPIFSYPMQGEVG